MKDAMRKLNLRIKGKRFAILLELQKTNFGNLEMHNNHP